MSATDATTSIQLLFDDPTNRLACRPTAHCPLSLGHCFNNSPLVVVARTEICSLRITLASPRLGSLPCLRPRSHMRHGMRMPHPPASRLTPVTRFVSRQPSLGGFRCFRLTVTRHEQHCRLRLLSDAGHDIHDGRLGARRLATTFRDHCGAFSITTCSLFVAHNTARRDSCRRATPFARSAIIPL